MFDETSPVTSPIQVVCRTVDGCLVLDIHGDQFTYPYTSVLKTVAAQQLEEGHRHFILNFEHVRLVDSFGLATILSVLKSVRDQQGNLALCGLNETVTKLVKVTHLDKVLEIWPSEAQAAYCLTSL